MKKNFLFAFAFAAPLAVCAQGNLWIGSGATLHTTGQVYLVVDNASLTNDGNIIAGNSTVVMTGDAANTTIGGTASTNLNNLDVEKTNTNLLLTNNIAVNGNLSLNSGNLDLNGNDVNLGTTGLLVNETENHRILGATGGEVIATAALNAPVAQNPGNVGATFTSNDNLGTTTIRRGHIAAMDNSVERYYDVTAANNATANLTLQYFDVELQNNEATLVIWHSNNGGVTWSQAGVDANDAIFNTVAKNNVTVNALWTLNQPDNNQPTSTIEAQMGKENGNNGNNPLAGNNGLTAVLAPEVLAAYPNPTFDDVQLSFNTERSGTLQVQLFNEWGQMLSAKQVIFGQGNNQYQIDMKQFAAGAYHFNFTFPDGSVRTAKVIKINM